MRKLKRKSKKLLTLIYSIDKTRMISKSDGALFLFDFKNFAGFAAALCICSPVMSTKLRSGFID